MNTLGSELRRSESAHDDVEASWEEALTRALGPYDGPGGTSLIDRAVLSACLIEVPKVEWIADLTGLPEEVVEVSLADLVANGRLAERWEAANPEATLAAAHFRAIEAASGCTSCGAERGQGCVTARGLATAPHKPRREIYEARETSAEVYIGDDWDEEGDGNGLAA